MDDVVTVFVDDAVTGQLPSICVKEGVFTADRVDLELDASRRWMTIWRVHPNFAAAVGIEYESSRDR